MLVFITFKSSTIDIAQNNKSNKSVDIKKEDRLAAGIIKKLNAHNCAFFYQMINLSKAYKLHMK